MKEEEVKVEGEKSGENKSVKTKQEKDEVQITVTIECERKLSERLEKINKGFEMGRVTRKHLAVYIIDKMLAQFSEDDTQSVRQSTFTDLSLLDKLYREAKASGVVPQELKEFLWKSMSLTPAPKRSKKSVQSKYINDTHDEEGAA